MPPSQTPHRTPLKRVSQGSLFRLSRSGAYPNAPYGLGFLEPALAEFVDETEALQTNVEGLVNLSESLATFNESFASWLYIMNMNALTTDWPQACVPSATNIDHQEPTIIPEEKAMAAAESLKKEAEEAAAAARETELLANKTAMTEMTEGDVTTVGNTTGGSALSGVSAGVQKKKVLKPKMTAKERKERDMEIERIISTLPLEFRGSDPTLRKHMETVIEGILKSRDQTVKLPDLIGKPPDLNQARVNKCLIALVNRKVVQKDNSTRKIYLGMNGTNGLENLVRPSKLECSKALNSFLNKSLGERILPAINKFNLSDPTYEYNEEIRLPVAKKQDKQLLKIKDWFNIKKWYWALHHVMWANHITIRKGTGCFSYFMTTGVYPTLSLNIQEVTWLVNYPRKMMSTKDHIGLKATALAKHIGHVEAMHLRVNKEKLA
ncbi:hypothetical protein AN958_08149 [Leucoagaricus sp. SymC.cos]|nr:hypothetical protein AN958_08149 [Leucoagaricus sp. SymC.cos]